MGVYDGPGKKLRPVGAAAIFGLVRAGVLLQIGRGIVVCDARSIFM